MAAALLGADRETAHARLAALYEEAGVPSRARPAQVRARAFRQLGLDGKATLLDAGGHR
jgi:hypothetical protein